MTSGKSVAIVLTLAVAGIAYLYERGGITGGDPAVDEATPGRLLGRDPGTQAIAAAYRDRRSHVQVEGRGLVERVLQDDRAGSRHQRFVLRLDNGQTLLVAHNIDLAPRIPDLSAGDTVAFHGEYAWNDKGGVIHWTHHDPAGRHVGGWLRHNGKTYR